MDSGLYQNGSNEGIGDVLVGTVLVALCLNTHGFGGRLGNSKS